jgi:GNAT superfamily N-acetyltransferase
MEIALPAPPPAPAWPPGITLRGFVPGQDDHAVHALIQECFQDIEGYRPTAFADWRHFLMESDDFNPALWYLAQAGDTLVGAALCSTFQDLGWINQLAVRRPWRRLGLGRALLFHAFGVAYRAGYRKAGLGVSAANKSGANALYERVGMHIAVQVDSYEKTLCRDEGHTG